MTFVPKPHEIYKHFKGNLYQIVAVAEHTETREQLVIYQAMYGDFKIYARPLDMFTSPVDKAKYPDVKQYFRFELQGPDAHRQLGESESKQSQNRIPGVQEVIAESKEGSLSRGTMNSPTPNLDPMLLSFLDADSYSEKLDILNSLHPRITEEMISTMAVAIDIELNEGTMEEKYEALKNCLLTLEKYECNRLR